MSSSRIHQVIEALELFKILTAIRSLKCNQRNQLAFYLNKTTNIRKLVC